MPRPRTAMPGDDAPVSPPDARAQALLARVLRFLVNATHPGAAMHLALHGYTTAEHAEGWSLLQAAAGAHRPFEHLVEPGAVELHCAGLAQRDRLAQLDTWRATWWPRVVAALRRFADEKWLHVFEASMDASQELGGAMAAAVMAARMQELWTVTDPPGVAAAARALARRGLTREELARVHAEATALQKLQPAPEDTRPADEVEEGIQRQRQALQALERWYVDWLETLRDHVPYHDAVRLGLRPVKGGHPGNEAAAKDG